MQEPSPIPNESNLIWTEESRQTVFTCPVFSISERMCLPPHAERDPAPKKFFTLDSRDWAIVIPALETEQGRDFLMVRQWRHGAQELSLEFPGGVFEPGESAEKAAVRELREETGYTAGKIQALGVFNPNPAIMSNRVHFFLALDLKPAAGQELDEDEYVAVETIPWNKVLSGLGRPPYIHALMGTALSLYLAKGNNLSTFGAVQ